MNDKLKHPVILFDGVCNLCSSSVQFIIKHDKKKIFRFASLQSAYAASVLQQYNLSANNFNSFVLLKEEKAFTKSTAALMVVKQLNGLVKLLYCFIIIPPFIRNAVYTFIANNRYKWFGKKEVCWLPTKELKSLFIN
ncbi:MAG: thiol-disulfide oxidoreductase DCC family protein [Bacteroidetes bacterium]|nr:thiol-disulfide oxidoreductase DCC family protein [Bacteroidota bacterium]MBS1592057.1 thiol-disulfide oxidoreductase DCC family protein [Bacteroidota bacterium]